MAEADPRIFHNRRRAESFGTAAELYDEARPSYPPELIDWLSDPTPGSAVDVGCGTGQVARLLSAAGWRVIGVEADERMAAVARSHGLEVDVCPFEQWQSSDTFDLVCSGQAWHWIDPDIGFARAASLLRPGGRLALFWNSYCYDAPTAAVFERVVGEHAPDLLVDSVPFGTTIPDHAALDADVIRRTAQSFEEPEFLVFNHSRRQSVGEWLAELLTHSAIALVADTTREALLADLRLALAPSNDGFIDVEFETRATTALRR